MSNKDLFKEAIADAKALREAALINAKAALEESFTPKLKSMISAKLSEMAHEEDEDELEEVDYSELDAYDEADKEQQFYKKHNANEGEEEDELEEDFDLSAILAELDGEMEEEDELEEAQTSEEDELEETKEEDEEESDKEEDEEDGDDKISDLTVEELKSIIHDIISAELGEKHEEEAGDDMDVDLGDESEEEEDVDLEELLSELDEMYAEEEEELEEGKKKKTSTQIFKKDLDYKIKSKVQPLNQEKELKEAIAVIKMQQKELNEQNLLNAKLLYVNKLFNAKNLTESQKLKVITSFDKISTPKQAKELYESLQNSKFSAPKKSQIRESLGFASKAAGVAPQAKNLIVESTDVITRMQKLANIIK